MPRYLIPNAITANHTSFGDSTKSIDTHAIITRPSVTSSSSTQAPGPFDSYCEIPRLQFHRSYSITRRYFCWRSICFRMLRQLVSAAYPTPWRSPKMKWSPRHKRNQEPRHDPGSYPGTRGTNGHHEWVTDLA